MVTPIKVFLVEDSPVALNILQRILNSSPDIEVIGTANNGVKALQQIPQLKPDVVCTDLLMGKMDGLELTRNLMSEFPLPILVISDLVTDRDTQKIGQLLEAGVVDVFPKPETGFIKDYERQTNNLVNKLKILSGVKVFTKKINRNNKTNLTESQSDRLQNKIHTTHYQIVAIGVSTGGPKAIQQIISQLPVDFPLPIVCTQHISVGFLNSLISWLSMETKLKVKVAQIGETPLPGTLYYAPEHYHLEIDRRGNFAYSSSPAVNNHRPSVTTMFQSIAQFYGSSVIAILLTGMGRDGVVGMQEIHQCGGLTIAQDKNSSVIFGMPQEAIKLGIVDRVLSLEKIAPFLLNTINYVNK